MKLFEEVGAKLKIEQLKQDIQEIQKRIKSGRGQDSDAV